LQHQANSFKLFVIILAFALQQFYAYNASAVMHSSSGSQL